MIAGHETTGGTLSFAMYNLLKHPDTYRKAQQEVDEVIGDGPITVDHVAKLQFIQAVRSLDFSIPKVKLTPWICVDPTGNASPDAYYSEHRCHASKR